MSALGDRAVEALLVEARLTPKPGLVDADNPGAHDDMNLALLERSAYALAPAFDACAQWGQECAGDVEQLRRIGVDGERDMLAATQGVNTHRGALFALGLWCAALARTDDVDAARGQVRELAAALTSTAMSTSSAGERARDLGVGGAVGQALAGYPLVCDVALPYVVDTPDDVETCLLRLLVRFMSVNEDSNLVTRGGLAGLARVQVWARDLDERSPSPAELREELQAANAWFCAGRLSPGGSADLLALTWFLAQSG